MTFEDWLIDSIAIWPEFRDGQKFIDNDDYRFGQHLVNCLYDSNQTVHDKMFKLDDQTRWKINPYYLDENVGNFLAFVHQNWSK